jgi:hypothetical protein
MPAPNPTFLKILISFPLEISKGQTVPTNHMSGGLGDLKR